MITLRHKDFLLDIAPERGGGITRFHWRDIAVFRDAVDGSTDPLDLSSFPMIPFSNRIADGKFRVGDTDIVLSPNHMPASARHPLHGLGWLAPWDIVENSAHTAVLRYTHTSAAWPWSFRAEQRFELTGNGLLHSLSITNMSDSDMPAGMGFHPYFPRENAKLNANFEGFWNVTDDGLPTDWQKLESSENLLDGKPVDTLFTGLKKPPVITWPTHRVTINAADNLPHVHIYLPEEQDYFCFEPVSHMTNAINRDGLQMVHPGENWKTHTVFTVEPA